MSTSTRRITVILQNAPDCELERRTVSVAAGDDEIDTDEAMNLAIHEVMESWILSPGDTIQIVEERS